MIDPTEMTDYEASDDKLEEMLLFAVTASNNTAAKASVQLERLLTHISHGLGLPRASSPFLLIREWMRRHPSHEEFRNLVKGCGIGKHGVKHRCMIELAHSGLNLRTCSLEDLEAIHGIKYKTSRFFTLSTRPGVRYAALDTHMLGFLRDNGVPAPKGTPTSSKKYLALEEKLIELIDATGRDLAEFDLDQWNQRSTRSGKVKVKSNGS